MIARPLALTTASLPWLTWQIAAPMSVGVLFNTLIVLADTYFAGWLGTEALAALAATFPIYFTIVAVGSGLSQGATAIIANAVGAGDALDARRLFAQSLLLSAAAAILVAVLGWALADVLVRELEAEGRSHAVTTSYARCLLGGAPFLVLALALNGALFALGETRVYRGFLIIAFALKCLLNPILMWGLGGFPALGLSGIGWATGLVYAGGCVLFWRAVRRTPLGAEFFLECFRLDWSLLGRLGRQSLPAILNMESIAAGLMLVTWFVRQFGPDALAGYGLAARLEQVVLLPLIGLGAAVLALVGNNFGARELRRVREAWAFNVRLGVLLMVLGAAFLYFLAEPVCAAFTRNPRVAAHATEFLRVAAGMLIAYPALFATTSLMNGLRRPAYGLWMGLFRQVLAPLGLIPLFAYGLGWGLAGIWWALLAGTWAASVIALWWGWRVTREW